MDEIDFAEVVGRPVRAVDEWVPARGGQGSDVWRVQTDQGPVIVRRPREVPPGRGPFMITLHRLFGITPWDVASVAAVHAAMAPLAPVPAVLRCRPPFLVVQHLPGTPPRKFTGLGGLLGDRLGRIHARSFAEWGHPAGPPRHLLATFHPRLAGVVPHAALRDLPPPPEATCCMADIDAGQFLLEGGRLIGPIDLEAYVLAPPALELAVLECQLEGADAWAFAQAYSRHRPLPLLGPYRHAYRLFHHAIRFVHRRPPLAEWLGRPPRFP